MVVVEVRQGAGGGGEERRRGEEERRGEETRRGDEERRGEERRGEEEQATDIKSNNPHLAGGEKHKKNPSCSHQYDFHLPLLRLDDQSNSLQVGSAVSAFSCHAQKSLLSKFDIGISNGMPHASSLSAPCG